MSSDEVKVKFVADTTGLQNATVPSQIPAAGSGAGGNKNAQPPGGGGAGGSGGGSSGTGGNQNNNNRRAAFPWEKNWNDEFSRDMSAQFAEMLSGANLLNLAFDGVTATAKKFVEVLKLGEQYAQKIEKASRITGLTTTEIQKYGYAAQMTGVSFDTFTNAMANANKELGKLNLYGGTGVVALSRLQINIDGVKNHSVNAIDVLKKMADAYKKHAETAEMAALGNQLFGGSFKDMIPMLRQGSREIERMAEMGPKVGVNEISAASQSSKVMTGFWETVGATQAARSSGYMATESLTARKISEQVGSGKMTADESVEKLMNPADRNQKETFQSKAMYWIDFIARRGRSRATQYGYDKPIDTVGIKGAGEDTNTVRERFISMRGGKLEKLSDTDKSIVEAFDKKIAEEGKMNLQSGIFQAASKMQQVGGGDVLSAISRVDFAEQTSNNTLRTAEAVEKIANSQPGGGGNTPPPPDTNGPVAK
jgi:hypothetical protein